MKSTDSPVSAIRKEIAKAVVGQEAVIDRLLITLFAGGHAIIEGVPGLAKTLLVHSLASAIDLTFNRIQFTPDMVPSDITGSEIIVTAAKTEKDFRFVPGPVFSNIVLADEINRTPPKTQSALLQSMQERQVTLMGKTYDLPDPFFVFATQNPIEYEGTYPLPEAQLDRFLLYIDIGYPSFEEEMAIVDADPAGVAKIKPVVKQAELKSMIAEAAKMPFSEKLKAYVVNVVSQTRPETSHISEVKRFVEWGAGPRAAQMVVRAAKARAFLGGKNLADKEDVDAVLAPALKHRIILNYNARSDNITAGNILAAVKKECEKKL